MAIYLIRHTTVDCPQGICYGATDLDVTTRFKIEKQQIEKKLKAISFDKVYSSPLQRCKKLAHALFNDQKILIDDRLQEMDFGLWEQKSWDAIFESPEGKYWMDNYVDTRCPQGESFIDLQQRVTAFYKELPKDTDETVAIVTHNGVIRVFKSLFLQLTGKEVFDEKGLDYGGIAKLNEEWTEL